MAKRRAKKSFYSGQLSDFGPDQRKQHDHVIIENTSESWSKTVKQARVLSPIELYAKMGHLVKDDPEGNELYLQAGRRFFWLFTRHHSIDGSPKVKSTLMGWIGGGGGGLYESEKDADIVKEFRELKGYIGAALYPYIEDVVGYGEYAANACKHRRCNSNQYMHSLRQALEQCVRFWGMG